MKQLIKAGTTSKMLAIFVGNSSVATGAGLTGLTGSSAGMVWYYYREGQGTASAITLAAETAGTWTSGGFVELSSAHMPGIYELGVPNVALATGANWVVMQLQGATNMVPVNVEVELVAFDPTDAIRLGLTALPGTAAASTGGLPTIGTGAGNIDLGSTGRVDVGTWLGTAVTAATGGVPDVNVKNYNNVVAQTDANNLPKIDVVDIAGAAVSTASAQLGVNVVQYATATASVDGNGLPKIDVVDFGGTAGTFVAGVPDVIVATNSDKSGYVLTQTFPTNFSTLAINASGFVTVGTNSDKTGYTLSTGQFTVKKDTALSFTFPMFSGVTGQLATGLTVVAQRSIDQGAIAPCANGVTELGSGLYNLTLAASDLNGTSITLILTAATAADQSVTFITQA